MSVQQSLFTRSGSATLVALLGISVGVARAQSTPTQSTSPQSASPRAEFRVQIDSVVVGTATAVLNLPVAHAEHAEHVEHPDHAAMPEHADSARPGHDTAASKQASVVVRTSDPALLGVLRAWMSANNSGTKDTVRPRLVEIDQAGRDGVVRYVLHDAWPSRIEPGDTTSAVTIVYQRAEVLH